MKTVTIYPAPGRDVRAPENDNKPLPEDGLTVVLNAFWHRCITDGDVLLKRPVEVAATPGDASPKAERKK